MKKVLLGRGNSITIDKAMMRSYQELKGEGVENSTYGSHIGLGWGKRHFLFFLKNVCLFGCTGSSSQHLGSSVGARGL